MTSDFFKCERPLSLVPELENGSVCCAKHREDMQLAAGFGETVWEHIYLEMCQVSSEVFFFYL